MPCPSACSGAKSQASCFQAHRVKKPPPVILGRRPGIQRLQAQPPIATGSRTACAAEDDDGKPAASGSVNTPYRRSGPCPRHQPPKNVTKSNKMTKHVTQNRQFSAPHHSHQPFYRYFLFWHGECITKDRCPHWG